MKPILIFALALIGITGLTRLTQSQAAQENHGFYCKKMAVISAEDFENQLNLHCDASRPFGFPAPGFYCCVKK